MACREQRKAQSEPQARASFRASSWRPPVSDRPTLTLYARMGKGEVALGRWPTTIGGWKMIERSDGSMALKYKARARATASS
jgi:hypothetical protein